MNSFKNSNFENLSEKIVITALFFLIVVAIALPIMEWFSPNKSMFLVLGGVSTFVIALLTIAYVVTNSKQLSIMKYQLDEMRKNRILEAQPLPIISIDKIYIEPPRFFYSPPTDEFSVNARFHANFSVNNKCSFPAVDIDISGWLLIRKNENDSEVYGATSNHFDYLVQENNFSDSNKISKSFMFVRNERGDDSGGLLETLRSNNPMGHPYLLVRILYKNFLGACFVVSQAFQVHIKEIEDDEVLRNWHSSLVSFRISHKNDLADLLKMKKENRVNDRDKIFQDIKKKLVGEVGEKNLELISFVVPGKFQITSLSPEEYVKEKEGIQYGQGLPSWFDGCLHTE